MGSCNSDELYKIIDRYVPEIIFEELSPAGFKAIYAGSRPDTLETNSIKRYLQKNPISHFPVDINGNELIDIHLKRKIVKMFDIFDQSYDYRELTTQNEILAEHNGVPYLNSEQCRSLLERQHVLEEVILKIINQEELFQTYKNWLDILNRRRNEMIKNIYSHSHLRKYDRALYLVGAEHKNSIIDKVARFEKDSDLKLNWIFNYFG